MIPKKVEKGDVIQISIIYLDKTTTTIDFDINKPLLNILQIVSKEYPNIIQIYENEIDGIIYTTQIINVNIRIKSIFETDYALVFGTSGSLRAIFHGNVMLQGNFNKVIFLQDCEFCGYFSAIECNFYDNVFFDNTIFKGYVYFSKSQFNKTACFYGVTFEKTPNFSQAIFNGNLNFINTKLNFDINEYKESIKQQLKRQAELYGSARQNTNLMLQRIPILEKIANDFRDSFRSFKSALIKDNNLLDASNYHKIELYFKEIELDSKKPKPFSKEWIDFWQLKFYRLTSNHHTDLLKSFNSLIILIGIFVIFGLCIVVGFNKCLGFCDSNPHAIIEFYNTHIKNAVINYKWIAFGCNALLSLAFVFLFCICQICGIARKIALWICYPLTFAMLISSPKYLIPAIGIFTDRRISLDPLVINGSLYTIFFGFMIYSFIKTLRKNSIIPN